MYGRIKCIIFHYEDYLREGVYVLCGWIYIEVYARLTMFPDHCCGWYVVPGSWPGKSRFIVRGSCSCCTPSSLVSCCPSAFSVTSVSSSSFRTATINTRKK